MSNFSNCIDKVIQMKKVYRKLFVLPIFAIFPALVSLPAYSEPVSPQQGKDRWNPWWTNHGMWGAGMHRPGQRQRMARHWTFMNSGIPQEYSGVRSPFAQKPEVVQEGSKLYQQHCSVCHGAQGMGDGAIANSLNPSPALLAYMIQMPMMVDGYLLWSISDGGKEFGTDMPAFKDQLSQDQIWRVIAFMRAGFPSETQNK